MVTMITTMIAVVDDDLSLATAAGDGAAVDGFGLVGATTSARVAVADGNGVAVFVAGLSVLSPGFGLM